MIIVDRIENSIAVCEDNGTYINIPKEKIFGNLREGAILTKTIDGYTVAEDQTEMRKKEIFQKQNKLFSDY